MLKVLSFLVLLLPLSAATRVQPPDLTRARRLIEEEKLPEALAVLDEAKAANGTDPSLLYLRGYVLYRMNKLSEAKQDLKSSATATPTALRSHYILARIAESEGQRTEAIRWLRPCAEAEPPVDDALPRISKLYWEVGQIENSQVWTERALRKTPWDGSLHYRLARIYQIKGQAEQARVEFAASSRLKSADSTGVRKLMECSEALSAKDLKTALRVREEFIGQSELDPDLLVALGTTFATAGSPEQAIDLYTAAVARDPQLFQAHFNLGLAMLNLNRPDAAIEPLQRSLELAPESKQANAALGLSYVMQNRYSDAVAPLEAAREADRHDTKTAGLLSVAYYRSGAAAKAIPILRDVLQNSKQDPKFYFLLIDCLNADAQEEEALAVSTEAAARFPQLAKAWLSKGQQLARLGKYHEAGVQFAKAAELEPGDIDALLGMAEAQQKDGDYQGSFETYQRALARDGDVTAALGAARSLMFLGKPAEARTVLEQFAGANANNSQLHFELSRIYARLGEKDLAAQQAQLGQQLRIQESSTATGAGPQ
jgi:tetratricopeptide (TPR) repeat protein